MSLHCVPKPRHICPSLVLVQPRKTRPCLTERLLMGRKESNQTRACMSANIKLLDVQKVIEFDQIIPQSETADQPTAP